MLICNAGIVLERWEQVRGLEKQFVVNHLGHFILVKRGSMHSVRDISE